MNTAFMEPWRCVSVACRIGLLLSVLMLLAGGATAGEYTPRGLYDVDHRVLDNGLRVILRPRRGAVQRGLRLISVQMNRMHTLQAGFA